MMPTNRRVSVLLISLFRVATQRWNTSTTAARWVQDMDGVEIGCRMWSTKKIQITIFSFAYRLRARATVSVWWCSTIKTHTHTQLQQQSTRNRKQFRFCGVVCNRRVCVAEKTVQQWGGVVMVVVGVLVGVTRILRGARALSLSKWNLKIYYFFLST